LSFVVLAAVALTVVAGCSSGAAPSASRSPSEPSFSSLSTHAYPAKGFAVRLPIDWRVNIDRVGAWQLTSYPPAGHSNFPGLTVGVETTSRLPRASTYDAILSQRESGADVHHGFRATTVNGMPVLMAAYARPSAGEPPLELEWYVVSANGRVYSLYVGAPRDQWPSWAPRLRELVDTLTVSGGT
jgi:hypothetical protein